MGGVQSINRLAPASGLDLAARVVMAGPHLAIWGKGKLGAARPPPGPTAGRWGLAWAWSSCRGCGSFPQRERSSNILHSAGELGIQHHGTVAVLMATVLPPSNFLTCGEPCIPLHTMAPWAKSGPRARCWAPLELKGRISKST